MNPKSRSPSYQDSKSILLFSESKIILLFEKLRRSTLITHLGYRYGFAFLGFLLAQGAPMGYFFHYIAFISSEFSLFESFFRLWQIEGGTLIYIWLGTSFFFTLFGYTLGVYAQQLSRINFQRKSLLDFTSESLQPQLEEVVQLWPQLHQNLNQHPNLLKSSHRFNHSLIQAKEQLEELSILNHYQNFSKPLYLIPTDLREIVQSSLETIRIEISQSEKKIGWSADSNLPLIPIDQKAFTFAWDQILNCAIYSCGLAGSLYAELSSNQRHLLIQLHASPRSITTEELEQLFSYSDQGLGSAHEHRFQHLLVARQIIRSHQGQLRLQANQDLIFDISLPK